MKIKYKKLKDFGLTKEAQIQTAKLIFMEEVLERMEQIDMSRSELACKLKCKPSFITKLLDGRNNFTFATAVRVAMALNMKFIPILTHANKKQSIH